MKSQWVKARPVRLVKLVDIGEQIIKDHKDFRHMILRLWSSHNDEIETRKSELSELMHRLSAHHVAEEKVLFPAMEELRPEKRFALELIEEHRSMSILYLDLDATPYGSEIWVPRLKPILEIHETHMAREESALIPKLPSMFDKETLDRMSADFARVLEEENRKQSKVWQELTVH